MTRVVILVQQVQFPQLTNQVGPMRGKPNHRGFDSLMVILEFKRNRRVHIDKLHMAWLFHLKRLRHHEETAEIYKLYHRRR